MLIRPLVRCAAWLLVAGCLGCGGDPATPSSTSASIAGTIRTAAASQMQVGVAGTALTTGSDPAGRFRLNDVPPGNVTLSFNGGGANARLPLGRVNPGDRLTLVVSVDGSSAHLDSREAENEDDQDEDEDDDDGRDNRKVEGRIADFSGARGCPIVTFSIGATTVTTDGHTRFKNVTCTTLANGTQIEAQGAFSNGMLLAKEIEKN